MKCPQCDNDYVCPCEHCRKRHPELIPWIGAEKTNGSYEETCPKCGLTKDANEWMDIEWEQMEKIKAW